VRGRWNAGLRDGGIDAGDPEQIRALAGWIRRLRPEIVLVHFGRDPHPDHVQASLLVDRSAYLAGLQRYEAPGEPFRPSSRYHYASRVGFTPSFVVDITATWTRKRESILAYRSQVQRGPGARETALNEPDFLVRIEARARHYGGMIGVALGEPFASDGPFGVREIGVLLRAARPHPSTFTG
jgi:bacillithiol biosynthesis deacetylase BshB1